MENSPSFKNIFEHRASNNPEQKLYRLEHLMSQAPVTIYTCEPEGVFGITFLSDNIKQLLGYKADDFLQNPDLWINNIHPNDKNLVISGMNDIVAGKIILRKYRFKMKNGHWKWIRDRAKLISNSAGKPKEIIGVWTDISELIYAEEALRQSEEKHRFLLEQINAGVMIHGPDSKIISLNQQAIFLLGLSEKQIINQVFEDFSPTFLCEDETLMPFDQCPVNQVMRHHKAVKNRVIGINRPDLDDRVWVMANAFPEINNKGELLNITVTLIDITEHVNSRKQIYRLAHYDTLTQLPNRSLIHERIDQAIIYSDWENKSFALLFLDLDNFKIVNDTLGHHTGDLLLQLVSKRIKDCLCNADIAGRLGGDEFVVLLPNTGAAGASKVSGKIIDVINTPFEINEHFLNIGTSIGISIYPHDGDTSDVLTRHADIAMYHAKNSGGRKSCFFDFEMNSKIEYRLAMERDLQLALEQEQFLLHYQPQTDLVSGQILAVEALIRWPHPQHGMISPAEFIPVSEDCGLIMQIGLWVLKQACLDIKSWLTEGHSPIKVAINLSLRQLQNPLLFCQIIDIINENDIPPDCLELELTESMMMENHEVTFDFMAKCRNFGINFSIDDFGTGYSSLSYLTKLPLDKLKIDRAFIKDISKGSDANTIVSAIVSMAKSLRLKVVAEGVETEEQLEYLKECGCDTAQGFYFSPAVSYDQLTQIVKLSKELDYLK